MSQRVIIETRDGRAVGVLIDNGSGEETRIFVTEASPVYSNERRGKVRLELRADVEMRELDS